MNVSEMKQLLMSEGTPLNKVYSEHELKEETKRWTALLDHFTDQDADVHLFSAPGRTEIGGNHTDHQNGRVLAAAISLDTAGAACKTDDMKVVYESLGFTVNPVDLTDLSVREEEKNTTESLIRGIAAGFVNRGYKVGGLKIYAESQVLPGSGMSSSAAFEVLIGTIFSGLYNEGKVTPVEIAIIGQYAENVYFGKGSGLMDQTASACGGCVAIDFDDPAHPQIERLDWDLERDHLSLVLTDCKQSHADLSGEYTEIPEEMFAAARICGAEKLHKVTMEDLLKHAGEIREQAGDRSFLRAYHFLNETNRAKQEADALRAGNTGELLRLIKESGTSSWKYLQNISVPADRKHQSLAVGLALSEEVLKDRGAYRVHGGGFAGTIQAFVPDDLLESYISLMESVFGKGCSYVLRIREAGGVMIR
ncbi:MAG: galactokinase family protein [Erysipelotrichaceae bacterium]|nr:galactokinase family protein [Erysipelotrichaceae bacterium]